VGEIAIIDAHIHLSNIAKFRRTAVELSGVDYSAAGLEAEFRRNDVVLGIGMGVTETLAGGFPDERSANPMGLDMASTSATAAAGELPSFVMECVGINPVRLAGDAVARQRELDAIEKALQRESVVGIKLYAGYYHYYVHDAVYEPVYELAARYRLPIVIHTGDTYSDRGLLKYSHPLTVDELAVRHRELTFVICHLGDPWVMDGAEVVYKNPNVFADLSGVLVGGREHFARRMGEPLLMEHFRRPLVYADCYDKMLYGSDWPLTPIGVYIDFVRRLVPEKYHEQVFYRNALEVFPRVRARLAGI
jgi:predicted TIM-barrel fold metal-dependent hydrolase